MKLDNFKIFFPSIVCLSLLVLCYPDILIKDMNYTANDASEYKIDFNLPTKSQTCNGQCAYDCLETSKNEQNFKKCLENCNCSMETQQINEKSNLLSIFLMIVSLVLIGGVIYEYYSRKRNESFDEFAYQILN